MALRGTLTHRKTRRLAQLLGIDLCFAMGLLEALWHVTGEQAPNGAIGRMSDQDIAMEMFYSGDPKVLIDSLIAAVLVDRDETHRLIVHDWHIHSDDGTDNKLARSVARYANGELPRMRRLSKPERAHVSAQYATPCAQMRTESHEKPLPVPEPVPEPEPVKEQKPKQAQAPFVLPDWIDCKAWDGFDGMRKKIRKPLTDYGRGLCVRKLESLKRAGHDPTDVLNQSTMKSYQGLFEVAEASHGTNHGISETRAERNVREAIELMDREEAEARSGGNRSPGSVC